MRSAARREKLQRSALKAVCDAADYRETYADYMHYGDALAMGLPIATGVIEGACRYLVKDRMERDGRSSAPKPSCAFAPSVPAATSKPTGTTIFDRNCVAITRNATPTVHPHIPFARSGRYEGSNERTIMRSIGAGPIRNGCNQAPRLGFR